MVDKELLQAISQLLDEKITPIKNDIKLMKADIKSLKSDINTLKSDINTLRSDINTLKADVTTLKADVDMLQSDVNGLKADMTRVNITLENETNKNIRIIAEGHLDLNRKLDEAIKIASAVQARQEVQDVYINIHESKLRAL